MKFEDSKSNVERAEATIGSSSEGKENVIQVEFHADANLTGSRQEGPARFSSPSDISGIQELLQKHRIVRTEPSFRKRSGTRAFAATEAPSDPDRARFINLHFPPDADPDKIVKELQDRPEVKRAVRVPKAIPPTAMPTDPLLGTSDQLGANGSGLENQWYVYRCRVDRAWSHASGQGVIIADIDFGFRTTHQDLANADLSRCHNAVDGTANVSVGAHIDHGTGVAGIAAASSNQLGIAGFAYDATLWFIQANEAAGTPLPGDAFANAIDWVTGADTGGKRLIINLEVQTAGFGNYEMLPAVNHAIVTAIQKGIVVCVAAGNGDRDAGISDDEQPIPPTGSILVGATSYDFSVNRRASFSNFGDRVVVAAPGDSDHDVTCGITSDDAYRNRFGGTSGATPKVSGTVALMLQVNPKLTPEEVKEIIMQTGTPVVTEPDKPVGVFLNSDAAVLAAKAAAEAVVGSTP